MPSRKRASSEPQLGQPGSVWVWRGKNVVEKVVEQVPKNEAAAVAWKAVRKPTLVGQLGTGNKISPVIQYPCSAKDPFNMAQGSRNHLSAEDRRLMRVMVKHSLRRSPKYPEAVYDVERKLIDGFGKNPVLKAAFYNNEAFANKLLAEIAFTIDTDGHGKPGDYQEPLELDSHASVIPGHHGWQCGPQCYCLRMQDAALEPRNHLAAKPPPRIEDNFQDSFANRAKFAATGLVDNLAAKQRTKKAATMG